MLKQEKGITLVALILIIFALLFLSGIAIAVIFQNNDSLSSNPTGGNSSIVTSYDDAQAKVKLIFELFEANYQTELVKGNVASRSEVFTADKIIQELEEYSIIGNSVSSLGNIDLLNGITINYSGEYTFLVRVSNTGIVTVLQK